VADQAMGGLGAPPLTKKLGLVMVAQSSLPQTRWGANFHLNPQLLANLFA